MTKAADVIHIEREDDIKRLKPREQDYMVGCGGGLWLRVRAGVRNPGGRRTFVIRRKQSGKSKVITLGDWPMLSLKEARRMALTVATPADATMADLIDEYRNTVIKRHARPVLFEAYAKRIDAALGRKRVAEVQTKQLADLVAGVREEGKRRAADSLKTHLKAMMGVAMERGWRKDNPALVIGKNTTGYQYEPCTRILSGEEIHELWSWQGHNAALLRFLLLTGLRISEGQKGSLEGDFWRLMKTKNKKSHWVFVTATAGAQLVEPFDTSPTAVQAWVRRKQKFTEGAWTPHDLRRTFATLAMDNGVLPHVVEKCLNHRLEGMLAVYAHAEMTEERIQAAKTVERAVMTIVADGGVQ